MYTKYLILAACGCMALTAGAEPGAAQPKNQVRAAVQKTEPRKPVVRKAEVRKTEARKAVPTPSQARPAHSSLPAPTALAPALPEQPMGQEELTIAQQVHHGHLPCELGASVRVEPDQAQPGYFNVQGKGFRFRMHPVATHTGAIRLEDRQSGAVWLQLANKSMLMDQKKGQRLADECAHPEQMAYAAQMKTNPPPALFDTTGMGR